MPRDSARPWIRRYGAAVALLVAGAAALIASTRVDGPAPARLRGPDHPVDPGARDLGDIRANNSPTLVRNPRAQDNLVVTGRVDSPDFSCSVHVSFDGGTRWSRTAVPIPPGQGRKCYAPDAVFAADGTLHVSYVTLEGVANRPSALWVASSGDGGRSLFEPHRVTGPLAFQARLAADPARPGRLYATWVQARDVGNLKFTGPGNPILAARSDDGGATWQRPRRVSDARRGRVLAPSAAIGPRGELYVLFLDVGDDRLDYEGGHEGTGGPPYPGRFALVLARSRDGGSTWGESIVDDRVVPIERFISFLPAFPSLAVDRGSGRVYVGFHDARLGSADVWVWSLAPGEAAWRGPVRVNDTARRDGTSQYLPQLAVAPGGRLDVAYYDRRADRRANVENAVSLQSSRDGGRTFASHLTLSSRSFDSRIGFGSERGLPTLGSRLGLVSDEDGALAGWSDTRAGTEASNKQDLVVAEAASARSGVRATAAGDMAPAGLALLLGGIAALLLGALRPPRPSS